MIKNRTKDFTLDNGFKVIHTQDNSRGIVALQVYIKCGSVWESPEEAGYSHFMEHLVFKSTTSYPNNSLMDIASSLGGAINAYTEYDSTCFYITIPSEYIREGVKILSELVHSANFNEKEFKSERQVVIEELKQYQNDPEENFIEKIPAVFFEHNPYRNPIVGTMESLKSSTPEKLREFYHKHYRPDNCFFVVSGDYQLEELNSIVDDYFATWNSTDSDEIVIKPEEFPKGFKYSFIESKIRKDLVAFVVPEPSDLHPDAHSHNMTMKAFASGKSSILWKRLYLQEQLVDSVKLYSFSGRNDGLAAVVVFPKKNKDIPSIYRIILEELARLKRYGLSSEAIRKHRLDLENSYKYGFEFIESLSSSLGSEEILGDYNYLYEYPVKIAQVNSMTVKKVINNLINIEHTQIAHTGKVSVDENELRKIYNEFYEHKDEEISTKKYEEFELPNGVTLQLKKVTGKPTVGLAASFKVSQLDEPAELRGINAMTVAMLQYGNIKRDYESLLEYCVENGISLTCDPMVDCTVIKSKCFSDRLSQTVALLADVIEQPLFPMSHVKQFKNTCLSALDRIKDYPASMAHKKYKKLLLGDTSRYVSSIGEKKHVKALTRQKVIDWYDKYYKNTKINIAVVGDIDFLEVKQMFEKYFKIKRTKQGKKRRLNNEIINFGTKVIDTKQTQAVINCGGKSCSYSQKEYNTSFFVLSQIIGGDMNSRLFELLREEHGLAYSVSFENNSFCDFGYFNVNCITDRDSDKFALKLIKETLLDIAVNGVTEEELVIAKNYIKGQRLIGEESMMTQAKIISYLKALGYDYTYYLTRDKRLEDVTVESIKHVASLYFKAGNFNTLIYK